MLLSTVGILIWGYCLDTSDPGRMDEPGHPLPGHRPTPGIPLFGEYREWGEYRQEDEYGESG